MRVDEIRQLYQYDHWASERLWAATEGLDTSELERDMSNGHGGIRVTLLHMASGVYTWRTRWQGETPGVPLLAGDFATLESVRTRWGEERQRLQGVLATLDDQALAGELRYWSRSEPARAVRIVLWQSLLHLINHQTQHRSEVAMQLTALGHSPGELGMRDFFAY